MTRKKRKSKNINIIFIMLILLFLFGISFYISYYAGSKREKLSDKNNINTADVQKTESEPSKPAIEPQKTDIKKDIIISSAGDCTIGTDDKFSYDASLPAVLRKNNNDLSYFFKNVSEIFRNDDFTTVNLETTFTNSTTKKFKSTNPALQFNFKAPPEYSKSLVLGNIEAVNISNNHIYDYEQVGFDDTRKALSSVDVSYFGEGYKLAKEIKGVKFGFLGYRGYYYDDNFLKTLKNDIQNFKNENRIVIINFHWGDEGAYNPNSTQKYIAHYAVDNGADLVIGHHPHVVQGIEKYKNKIICYSLGNFCFGGNSNPPDKDTFIFQTDFKFTNDTLVSYGVKVIPCSVSSVNDINDYCPSPLSGSRKNEVLDKINNLSSNLNFKISDDFYFIDVNN